MDNAGTSGPRTHAQGFRAQQREEVIKKLGVVPVRHMDMLLPGIALFLVGYGILIIYSATHSYANPSLFVIKQVVAPHHRPDLEHRHSLFRLPALKVASPLHLWFHPVLPAHRLVHGRSGEGVAGSLWIINYQPSEYAKLVMVLVLANVLSENKSEPESLRSFVIPVLWTLPVMLLIFIQPDLGTPWSWRPSSSPCFTWPACVCVTGSASSERVSLPLL